MLNYGTEKNVDAAKDSGSYDWLCVEFSKTQQIELEHVNEYRAEVGAEPLDVHPELVALANHRARTDAYYAVKAHDWIEDPKNEPVLYKYMDWMGIHTYSENTVKGWKACDPMLDAICRNYRNSKSHYDTMVSKAQKDFGTSNCYWSGHTKDVAASFDVFSDRLEPANTLKK